MLPGCNDPNEASTRNFEAAITDAVSDIQNCARHRGIGGLRDAGLFDGQTIYVADGGDLFDEEGSANGGGEEIEAFLTFARELGHLEEDPDTTFQWTDELWARAWGSTRTTERDVVPTRGSASLSAIIPESGDRMCYGRRQLVEVTNFTAPGEMFGMTVSQVEYSYELVDIPDWARSDAFLEDNPGARRQVHPEEPLTASRAVVLTGNGWVDDSELDL